MIRSISSVSRNTNVVGLIIVEKIKLFSLIGEIRWGEGLSVFYPDEPDVTKSVC